MDESIGKRRRAQKACHFCRQRKMRCGNEEPNCLNCVAYKEVCFYEQRPKKARPSNSQIARLEEENRLLQQRLEDAKTSKGKELKSSGKSSGSSVRQRQPTPPNESSSENAGDSGGHSTSSASPSRDNAGNEDPEFHGPTSVFFDETAPQSNQNMQDSGKSATQEISANLMTEAATQRQLEDLHLSSDQLDFDGIDPKLATELMSIFWARSNSLFMLVYRPVFMRDWANDGPYFSKLLLNAIYFNASRYVTDVKYNSTRSRLGERFHKRFKDLLGSSYDKSRVTTMQALLLVSVSLSAVGKNRSLAWLYSGLGFRMMFDLGLHTSRSASLQAARKLSSEDVESNRRLFWSAFVIDKLQSFYQGRPANVQEADTMVPLLFNDHYEEFEEWHPLPTAHAQKSPYTPMFCVSNFYQLCKLGIIMNKILNKIYREKSEVQGPEAIIRNLHSLEQELEDWRRTLPAHLNFSPTSVGNGVTPSPSPHIYVVHIMFHVIQILLHRPFVLYGHLQSVLPGIAFESFSSCAAAATCISQYFESYNRIHTFQLAPFFLFYASYVSATIHVRIAAQVNFNSDAFESLQLCLSVFDQNELNNPPVKKAKAVIRQMMDRMGVRSPSAVSRLQSPLPKSKDKSRTSASTTKKQKKYKDLATPVSTPQTDLPEDWNINGLDFDAILQSFSRPDPGAGGLFAAGTSTTANAQLPSNNWTAAELNEASSANFASMNQFGGGNMDDVLFGFDILSREEEWASPQRGSSVPQYESYER